MVVGDTANAAAARELARYAACEVFASADGRDSFCTVLDDAPGDSPGWSFTPVTMLFDAGRHGPDAGPWLFRVGLWVPGAQRDEFLAWYRGEHLPILLECATWNGCRFVEAPAQRDCRFYALHQLSDRAALASPQRARSRSTPWFDRLKKHAWFDGPFTRTLYRRVDG